MNRGTILRRRRQRTQQRVFCAGFFTTAMDWEFTFSQMMLLIINPKKVYTFSQYRHRMKKQWARDDPAFLIVLTYFILVTSVAYGIAFSATTFGDMMILTFYGVVSLLGTGVIISTACWHISNKYLRVIHAHGSTEQKLSGCMPLIYIAMHFL